MREKEGISSAGMSLHTGDIFLVDFAFFVQ